ncbi:vesicle-associated protein 2-1 [Prunus yedoensis var. nudiflora]|uniref:Vesicle-associated protein 2-1 n=1 Tax=Prunus yedoensis var. nudiflora TaxID=2094558 RepID=A0A314YDH2_PRUYE|nr:vesicle-associated protein 2-1 [Prunus yedoensis var. nudiflora]
MLLLRLKPLHLRSTLYDPTLVLYRLGTHVSSESPSKPNENILQICSAKINFSYRVQQCPQILMLMTPARYCGRALEECKLRVVYMTPGLAQGNSEDEALRSSMHGLDTNSNQAFQRLKDERDAAVRQTQHLQQELDILKRRRFRKGDPGFSFTFAIFVGLIGLMVGFLLNLSLSSPSTE